MGVPAIVTAGDGSAAKAVYGESKVFLEIEGLPLVAHVVRVLQGVPSIDRVIVVGNADRLRAVFAREDVRESIHKPLQIVPQFRHLWENCWEGYRRALPGAPDDGREPVGDADLDVHCLFLSGDLPFATPQEIEEFVRLGTELDCDYALGLVTEASLRPFQPSGEGECGIEVAYFNLREERLRQSNLHLVRPGRLGNRHYIEEMYQHRHQRRLANMIGLGWRLLTSRQGGLSVLLFYALMHMAGVADRWRLRRLADGFRHFVSLRRVERSVSGLLATRFRFVTTEAGGCAIDIDTEQEYDVSRDRFRDWRRAQSVRAEALYGPLALPASVPRKGER